MYLAHVELFFNLILIYTNSLSRVLWITRLDNHFEGSAAQLHRTWEKSGATKQSQYRSPDLISPVSSTRGFVRDTYSTKWAMVLKEKKKRKGKGKKERRENKCSE